MYTIYPPKLSPSSTSASLGLGTSTPIPLCTGLASVLDCKTVLSRARSVARVRQKLLVQAEARDPSLTGHRRSERQPQLRTWLWGPVVDLCPPLGSQEVLKRTGVTLVFIALLRLGIFIPLHGVDLSRLSTPTTAAATDPGSALFGMAAGVPAHIFMLGITPIFTASILVALMLRFPQLWGSKVKRGEEGVADAAVKTRLFACAIAAVTAFLKALQLRPFAAPGTTHFVTNTVVTLTAGVVVLNHIADETAALGLGHGLTLMLALPMLQDQARVLRVAFLAVRHGAVPLWQAGLAAAGIAALVYAALYISLIEARHETISYKLDAAPEIPGSSRSSQNFLPIRISPSGVSCLLTSSFYIHLILRTVSAVNGEIGARLAAQISRPVVMPIVLGVIAFMSCFVDFSFGQQIRDLSAWMQYSDVGLRRSPAIVPGEATRRFMQRQQALASFWGGLAVASLACVAHALDAACAAFTGLRCGATTMLLLTGFITTAYRQVEALSELPKLQRRIQREQQLLERFQS